MSTCTLQVRLDADLRKEADELFTNAGMDLSSAVRLFLRQSVIRRRLPFEVVTDRHQVSNQEETRDLPPWFGLASNDVRHDVPHDMASIRKSIGRGIAAELAERERGCMMVAED